ncbi:MAG: hypothetical protein QW607_00145 [Desulfurococcaceae archaeon]
MNDSNTLDVKSKYFKITIKNERVKTPSYEYSAHHIYLYGFKKADISVSQDRVYGEIEYTDIPFIEIDNDILSIQYNDEPVVKHELNELIKMFIENKSLHGLLEPLHVKMSSENSLNLLINDKYRFNASEINLSIEDNYSIVNILIYPLKLMWIYSPKALVKIDNVDDKIVLKISGVLNEKQVEEFFLKIDDKASSEKSLFKTILSNGERSKHMSENISKRKK